MRGRFAAQPLKRSHESGLQGLFRRTAVETISLRLSTVIHRSGCFFWHSCGELIQHRPHGYYRTGSSPIRSQRTIQPRRCACSGNRTQDVTEQSISEDLLRLLCLLNSAAHHEDPSEGGTRNLPARQFPQPLHGCPNMGRDRPEHTRCSRHGAREGRPDLTPGCQSPRCGRGYGVTAFVTCRSPRRSRRSQILRRASTWSPWSCSATASSKPVGRVSQPSGCGNGVARPR